MADIQKIKDKAIKDNQELAEHLYKINNQIKKLYKDSKDVKKLNKLNVKLEKLKTTIKDNAKIALKEVKTNEDCELKFLDLKITISANPENVAFNVNKFKKDTQTDKQLFELYNKYLTPYVVWRCTFNK